MFKEFIYNLKNKKKAERKQSTIVAIAFFINLNFKKALQHNML